AEGLLEGLGSEIFCGRAVAREEDQVAVDRVELLGRDLRKALPGAERPRSVERGRGRVHIPMYGAGAADRHMQRPICGCPPTSRPRPTHPLSALPARRMSAGSVAGMRRLLLLVGLLVFVDTMLYAALTPLLPHFAHEFGLSKPRAGVLVAAYAAGALLGAVPGGVAAARFGPRRAVLVGLTLMGLASLGFAFAGGFWTLFAARLLQGGASGFTWAGSFAWLLAAAPRERRGELIGTALGAAVLGALFGPVGGAAAALIGRAAVFCALAGLSVVLAAWTFRIESIPPDAPSVGLAFNPRPLAYVPMLIAASGAYVALFTPAFALIAEGAERSGLAQGMAFGLMNAAWASGALIGPAAGGAVAAASGDVVPFLIAAGLCAAAWAAVRRARHRTTARLTQSDLAR